MKYLFEKLLDGLSLFTIVAIITPWASYVITGKAIWLTGDGLRLFVLVIGVTLITVIAAAVMETEGESEK